MPSIEILHIPDDISKPVAERKITPSLDSLKDAIGGGWLERISGHGWSAYVDDEGRIKHLPLNVRATALAQVLGWPASDLLFGDAVFLGAGDSAGDETGVTDVTVALARRLGILD